MINKFLAIICVFISNRKGETMVSFKKALLGCVLAGIAAQSAFGAERDGAFVGVELGANKVKFKQELTYNMGQSIGGDIKADNLMPSIAIKGGYKLFFNAQRSFGARFYAQVGVGHGRLTDVRYSEGLQGAIGSMVGGAGGGGGGAGSAAIIAAATSSVFPTTGKEYHTTFIDYFVGADLLYNFAQRKAATYGLYLGVGVGGVTWAANGKEYEVSNGERSYTNFAANANFGLRLNVKDSHEIDLGVRTYFPRSKLFKASNGESPLARGAIVSDTKTYHYRPFSVLLSYVYSF